VFCNGQGSCDNNACTCFSGFSGPTCSITVTLPAVATCSNYPDCDNCTSSAPVEAGLNCSWCADSTACVATAVCQNVLTQCNAVAVTFVAEPCPDDCSGSNGVCVNRTCSSYTDAGITPPTISGIPACINDSTQTDTVGNQTVVISSGASNISYCLCKSGFSGNNCGGKSGGLGTALAISGGIIAVIVICGVILIVICTFGAKKSVDFIMLNQQANAHFKSNPLAEDRNKEFHNPLHHQG